MKKLLSLLFLLVFFIELKADHVSGAEISWTCLSNGKYIFELIIYRDCTGLTHFYDDEIIDIAGNPLPQDSAGLPVDKIIVKPDSNRWNLENQGRGIDECGTILSSITCENGNAGTVQHFYYVSDPIVLKGTPPVNGWKFNSWLPCCKSSNLVNVQALGRLLISATMYPFQNKNTYPCFDSSPKFAHNSKKAFYRGIEYNYSVSAMDQDFDSLSYSWISPKISPFGSSNSVTYRMGYNFNNPTPDTSFDTRNIASTLDSETGIIKFKVYNGAGDEKYSKAIQVDSWKGGQKISSVSREYIISILNITSSVVQNNIPTLNVSGYSSDSINIEVFAGEKIELPIQVVDNDIVNNQFQTIRLKFAGDMLTSNGSSSSSCKFLNAPCAYFENQSPILDASLTPIEYNLRAQGNIGTNFVWQTTCDHLLNQGSEASYKLLLSYRDDFCPLPIENSKAVKIRVKLPEKLSEPILKGVSVNLDGSTQYQWVAPIDSVNTFGKYIVQGSRPLDGANPINWNNVNPNEINYNQENRVLATIFPVYDFNNPLNPSQGINLFSEFGNSQGVEYDFYMRMKTLSGCSDSLSSNYSDWVQVMELSAEPIGLNATEVKLTWNRAKPLNAASKPYFKYESDTYYYIHQNDSVSNNRIQDSASWYIRDVTKDTAININSTTCNEYVGFRIEARDTVITFEQGAGISARKLDTLYFSTFSIIDTLKITAPNTSHIVSVGVDYLKPSLSGSNHQWIDCSNDSLLSATEQFVPTKQGDYSVIYQNICGFIDTTACYTTITLNDSVLMSLGNTLVSVANDVKYQWVNCKDFIPIPLETNKVFVPIDTGFYAVIVSAYGYSDTSDCIPVFSIGIQEPAFQEKVSFYPNPTSGNINIQLENMNQNLHINIRNVHGQLVEQRRFKQANNIEFVLKGEAGIYFIELINEKGERANLKVIKNK